MVVGVKKHMRWRPEAGSAPRAYLHLQGVQQLLLLRSPRLSPHVPHTPHNNTINMFKSLTGYFYERRAGFVRTAGVLGGAYLVGRYVLDRLEDVRSRVVQERLAREKCVFCGPFLILCKPSDSAQCTEAVPAEHAGHLVHDNDAHAHPRTARSNRNGGGGAHC